MKRLVCLLFALWLLGGSVLAETAPEGEAEEGEWALYESPFGYSFFYPESVLWVSQEEYTASPEESNISLICLLPRASRIPAGSLVSCLGRVPFPDRENAEYQETDEPDYDLALPYEFSCFLLDGKMYEEIVVLAAEGEYTFLLTYPAGDPDGLGELLRQVVNTLEFPPQPVINDDFMLDYFQGGAAGMRFIDVVYDEDAEPITLVPYRDMRDFVLEVLTWDDEAFSVAGAVPLYSADPLSPGDNLNIYCYFGDVLPNLRMRYTDAEGNARCWDIFQSGRDGSLLLLGEY